MGLLSRMLAMPGNNNRPAKSQLMLDGKAIEVTLRKNSRAKRIVLRLDKSGQGIVLTVPKGVCNAAAMEFAATQGPWIWQQLAKRPDGVAFKAGQTVPVRGVAHIIEHSTLRRTPVWIDEMENGDMVLCVSGDESHHGRRIKDWLKKQARADLSKAAHKYADEMDVSISKISIRDTTSRWGSCSSKGSLSFSWRLVLAPPEILDYVAAHEVAHLVHMDHSRKFWDLVNRHCAHADTARKWLKTNGRSLHRYGI